MQKQYGGEGLVVLTVSLDDLADKDEDFYKLAVKILTDKKVALSNYVLDEKRDLWQKKLNADAVPVTFVFNREGRIAQRFNEDVKDKKVLDKLVEDLLKEK